jgi:hypothetical protein
MPEFFKHLPADVAGVKRVRVEKDDFHFVCWLLPKVVPAARLSWEAIGVSANRSVLPFPRFPARRIRRRLRPRCRKSIPAFPSDDKQAAIQRSSDTQWLLKKNPP